MPVVRVDVRIRVPQETESAVPSGRAIDRSSTVGEKEVVRRGINSGPRAAGGQADQERAPGRRPARLLVPTASPKRRRRRRTAPGVCLRRRPDTVAEEVLRPPCCPALRRRGYRAVLPRRGRTPRPTPPRGRSPSRRRPRRWATRPPGLTSALQPRRTQPARWWPRPRPRGRISRRPRTCRAERRRHGRPGEVGFARELRPEDDRKRSGSPRGTRPFPRRKDPPMRWPAQPGGTRSVPLSFHCRFPEVRREA